MKNVEELDVTVSKIVMHILQNFPPINLNSGENREPKDATFGLTRRSRIASQAWKRVIRMEMRKFLSNTDHAERTRNLFSEVVRQLVQNGRDEISSIKVAAQSIALLGKGFTLKKTGDKTKTEVLCFLSRAGIDAFADYCNDKFDKLLGISNTIAKAEETSSHKQNADEQVDKEKTGDDVTSGRGKGKKGNALSKIVTKDLIKELGVNEIKEKLLAFYDTPEIAMNGRMLADLPEESVDAAAQVAHAISTHAIAYDFDFYTAVEDLAAPGEGSAMMDNAGFVSPCYYRYLCFDLNLLTSNLNGNRELAIQSILAYIKASIVAIPTGKQTSTAPHCRPDLVAVSMIRKGMPLSLVNAFDKPVRANECKDGISQASAKRMLKYAIKISEKYPDDFENQTTKFLSMVDITDKDIPQNWKECDSLTTMINEISVEIQKG